MELTLGQLAVQLDGLLVGGGADALVLGVAGYDAVGEDMVTYVTSERHLEEAEATSALAIIVPLSVAESAKPIIQVDDPRAAFGRALRLFDWRRPPIAGIDDTAVIAKSAMVHARAYVGPQAVVGEGSFVSDGAVIHPHAVVGEHVEVGAETVIHPGVVIYPRCTIGRRVIIHAGAVIGSDGLGFHPTPDGWEKIPHLGTVIIEDDVEIGANVTIDRATSGKTLIGQGTKIDNLVHIAHNVQVGANCMIVAQVGISGSSVIEDGVIMAGQAGISDHVRVGANARLGARAGVTRPVPPGATVSGFPARDHAEELRYEAALRRVPELLEKVKRLEQRVKELEEGNNS
ncbi:MAG: UDP-3-O-(3-hydroxymyristoyl)glucosamine N-acyltransferase [Armatimonadota bacterium]